MNHSSILMLLWSRSQNRLLILILKTLTQDPPVYAAKNVHLPLHKCFQLSLCLILRCKCIQEQRVNLGGGLWQRTTDHISTSPLVAVTILSPQTADWGVVRSAARFKVSAHAEQFKSADFLPLKHDCRTSFEKYTNHIYCPYFSGNLLFNESLTSWIPKHFYVTDP